MTETMLDTTPPEEFGGDGAGFKLRDARSVHPNFDPDNRMNFEGRTSNPGNYDDEDNYHYPDGTVVDAGPESSLELEDPYRPVTWDGFAVAEWFKPSEHRDYGRVMYNTHTGTLTVDKFNGTNYILLIEVDIPAERLGDPQNFVEEIRDSANPEETAKLLHTFFNANIDADALADLAGSEVFQAILG